MTQDAKEVKKAPQKSSRRRAREPGQRASGTALRSLDGGGHAATLERPAQPYSRSFSIVAITILALGIGASSAIFSVVNALLLAPLRYLDARELVQIQSQHPEQGVSVLATMPMGDAPYASADALAHLHFLWYNAEVERTQNAQLVYKFKPTAAMLRP